MLNADLWQALDQQLQVHRVEATWVRGHAGHPENERVDELASQAAKNPPRRHGEHGEQNTEKSTENEKQ